MTPDDLKKRTKDFSHRCVKLALLLPNDPVSNHIRHQMIRSSTSVSANYRAACVGHSKAAFTSKISIVVEEIDETAFWIEFLIEEGLLLVRKCESLLGEARELTSIFVASRKTSQNSN
ncbi:MAG: four helix bundle protein [Phycisphaerae bacterium]|nr:four helix bundle protein [Phycisphaerae bacterium]